MWKRMLMGCAILAVSIFPLFIPAASNAACGGDPPLPPEGFSWPASGPVITEWSLDCRSDRGHRGIDIAVSEGDPILASAAGVIVFAGYTPAEGGGITVSIEHTGGMRTTYLHLAQSLVSQGQTVSKGQKLGSSDGLPLHFGMKVASARETYFNPVVWLPPLDMPSPSASPTAEAVSGIESGPVSSSTPASGPAASQPSPVSASNVPLVIAAEPAMALSGTIMESPAGAITGSAPVTASGHMNSGLDAAAFPGGREEPATTVMAIEPGAPVAGPLLARFDDTADASQGDSILIARSTRQPSRINEDVSPMRYLLLAGLLITATATSSLVRRMARHKPALAF